MNWSPLRQFKRWLRCQRLSLDTTKSAAARRRHEPAFDLLETRLNPAPIQFFYVPLPEQPTLAALEAIGSGGQGNDMASLITIAATESGTIIHYDQWEDGYESILGSPVQASTEIWGDGDPTNGTRTGPADLINAGTIIQLRNNVAANPRNPAVVLFDGGDKLGSNKSISMSRAQFPVTSGSVISSGVEVRDTRFFDTAFTAPVGVDTPDAGQMFEYTALFVMASQNNTTVQIDRDNDGTFEQVAVINQGQNVVSAANVLEGGRVVADKPVQVHLVTGDIGSGYASRSYTLFSDGQAASDYFTPVGLDGAADPVRIFVYNPNAVSITVNYETQTLAGVVGVVAAGSSAFFDVPSFTGTRLFSTAPFLAVGAHDQQDTTHDWGFSLQPVSSLSQIAQVGLGVGNSDNPPAGSGNTSPIWVTPLSAARVYVDWDGDPATGSLTDPMGNQYDEHFDLVRLQAQKVRDTSDDDNSGMRLYTVDGTLIATAWGEDITAPTGSPGFDAGTTVPAIPVPEFFKFSDFAPGGDVNGDGFYSSGDTVRYTLRIRNIGTQPVSNAVIFDALPAEITYVNSTTFFDDGSGPVAIADSGATAFPLDEGGFNIANIAAATNVFITFDVTINSGLPAGTTQITNRGTLTYDIFTLPAMDVIDVRGAFGDVVFDDQDFDGVQDAGEPGVAGVTVALTWFGPDGAPGGGDDVTYPGVVTGAGGAYGFIDLPSGNFQVLFTPPAGYVFSGQNQGGDDALDSDADPVTGVATFSLAVGAFDSSIDAGMFRQADLQTTKTDGATEYIPGTAISYTMVVTNAGPSFVTGATVIDVVPAEITGVAWTVAYAGAGSTGPANGSGDINAVIDLAVGGTATFTLTGVISAAATGDLINTVTATPPAGTQDPNPGDNIATDTNTEAGTPDLQVSKDDGVAAVAPGDTLTYTINYANAGNRGATGVVITDTLPAGTSFSAVANPGWNLAAGVVTFAVGNLAAGASGSATLILTVDNPAAAGQTQIVNVASIDDDGTNGVDPNPGDNSDTDVDTLDAAPDLQISKDDGVATVTPGDTLTYTIDFANVGNQDATGVVITDTLPAGTSFSVAANPGWSQAGSTLTFTVGDLVGGVSGSVTLILTVDNPAAAGQTQIINVASIDDDGTNGVDPNPGDNSDTDTDTLDAAPDLQISKDDGVTTVTPGDTLTYTIDFANVGNQDATGVVLMENLPTGTSYVSAGSSAWVESVPGSGIFTLAIGNLASGGSGTAIFRVTVLNPLPPGVTAITNTATIDDGGGNGADPSPGDNTTADSDNLPRLTIAGTVFVDNNVSGARDPGEQGLAGVVLLLRDATNGIVATTTTAADGTYQFAGVLPGAYAVEEIQPLGYGSSTPNNMPLTLVGANASGLDFGEMLGSLAGAIYIDVNGNGTFDAGEPGIVGAAVTLSGTDVNGTPVNRNAVSGPGGNFAFANLLGGTFAITQPLPAGVSDGADTIGSMNGAAAGKQTATGNPDVISNIDAPVALNGVGYNFGELSSTGVAVAGAVWHDADKNGVRDLGEAGIGGVFVELRDAASGTLIQITATTADGAYYFLNVAPGAYRIIEIQPAGYGSSTPNLLNVSVAGAGLANLDFGDTLGSLSGFVYVDLNGDGVKDAGEPGIAGTIVSLTGTGANFTAVNRNTTTAADGSYIFTDLLASSAAGYALTETQPVGFDDGLDSTGTISGIPVGAAGNDVISDVALPAGQDGINYNFGDSNPPGQTFISGTVFVDANGDGAQGAGEPGLAGVTVSLVDPITSNVVAVTTTGPTGIFVFINVTPGTYDLVETQPTGYGSSTPDTRADVVVPPGGLTGQDFANTLGILSGSVYVDAGNDGVRLPGEAGIPGVVVVLSGIDAIGQPVNRTTATDANGDYSFANLLAGTYQIFATQAPGFVDGIDTPGTLAGSAAVNDTISGIVVGAGISGNGYNFGEQANVPASLGGSVYLDINGNGTRDPGEPGIGNVQVTLRDGANAIVGVAFTAPDGAYQFAGITPGAGYSVSEAQPAGFLDGADAVGPTGGTQTATGNPDTISGIILVAGANATGYTFGELNAPGTGNVVGNVFRDFNVNGALDGTEPGKSGVVVELLDAGGNVVATIPTDASGGFAFVNLPPGDFTARLFNNQPPTGFGVSTPTSFTLTVAAGGTTTVRFGLTTGSLAGFVFDDTNVNGARNAGEPGRAGVLITLSDDNGNPVFDADGNPVAPAYSAADGSYRFDNLLAGVYRLRETQPAGIYDGPDAAGTINGVPTGTASDDLIDAITLLAAQNGLDFNFGELPPTDPNGFVFRDRNNNGVFEQLLGETGIDGVTIRLTGFARDPNDFNNAIPIDLIFVTGADPNLPAGFYAFNPVPASFPGVPDTISGSNLPGYTLTELNGLAQSPGLAGLLDGKEQNGLPPAGSVSNDRFANLFLDPNVLGHDYNFGELVPSRLSGIVFSDTNNNGAKQAKEKLLAGARVRLTGVDDRGNAVNLIAVTNAVGAYSFANLRPSNAAGYTLTVTPPPKARLVVGKVGFPNIAGAAQQPIGSLGRIRRVQLLLDGYDLAGFNFGLRASSKRNFM